MVDIIENKIPTEFVGGYILDKYGVEVGELCREARAPEGLIMNLLMFGPDALADAYRLGSPEVVEAACKVFYSKAGIPRGIFWMRLDDTVYKLRESMKQPAFKAVDESEAYDESFPITTIVPKESAVKIPGHRASKGKKLSSTTLAKRMVTSLHNDQNKKKGQTIRLTPARAALAARGISVDTVRAKMGVSTNIVYPLFDGMAPSIKNVDLIKRAKKNMADYLIKDLGLPLDPRDVFKLRNFVWDDKAFRFVQPSKKSKATSIGFEPLTPDEAKVLSGQIKKSELDKITWSPPTTFKPDVVYVFDDPGDKLGILTRIKNWFKGD
jgi:hypothetical protein